MISRKFDFFHSKEQTRNIEEKQASVMAELSQVEPAVQEAKMGTFFYLLFIIHCLLFFIYYLLFSGFMLLL